MTKETLCLFPSLPSYPVCTIVLVLIFYLFSFECISFFSLTFFLHQFLEFLKRERKKYHLRKNRSTAGSRFRRLAISQFQQRTSPPCISFILSPLLHLLYIFIAKNHLFDNVWRGISHSVRRRACWDWVCCVSPALLPWEFNQTSNHYNFGKVFFKRGMNTNEKWGRKLPKMKEGDWVWELNQDSFYNNFGKMKKKPSSITILCPLKEVWKRRELQVGRFKGMVCCVSLALFLQVSLLLKMSFQRGAKEERLEQGSMLRDYT